MKQKRSEICHHSSNYIQPVSNMLSTRTLLLAWALEFFGYTNAVANGTKSAPQTSQITPPVKLGEWKHFANWVNHEANSLPMSSVGEWWGTIGEEEQQYYSMNGKKTEVRSIS
jgi:hypothetical protein